MRKSYSVKFNSLSKILILSIISLIAITYITIVGTYLIAIISTVIWVGYLYISLTIGYLSDLIIDENQKEITFINKRPLGNKTKEIITFDKLSFTYRKRVTNNQFSFPSLQTKNVLIVDSAIKTHASLSPDEDGWEDNVIKNIVSDLLMCGIKRVTDKYSDKEVNIIVET